MQYSLLGVFFLVLLVEVTHAVQSLTKSDRCVINAKRAVGGAKVAQFRSPGAPRVMFDVLWCSPRRRVCKFVCGCVLLAASRGANHHGAITLVYCFPTHETVK